MKTAALTLFDLGDINPDRPQPCGRCGNNAATLRVYAIQNLLGVHPTPHMTGAYRDAFHRAHSGPCCTSCAWSVAGAWWGPVYACPSRGSACQLWAHTLTDPRPGWDCTRHHQENAVVWHEPAEVTS